MPEEASLESVLDDLQRSGRADAVSVGDVLETFERRSLGVLLTLLGLVVVLPVIGDIPGAAILCATLVLAAVGQSLFGRGTLWAPGSVRRREIGRQRFDRGIELARPWIARIDRILKPRLVALAAGPAQRWGVPFAAAVLALALYPLAFVPFAANLPGLGLMALGLGLIARDGLLALIGLVLAAATLVLLVSAL